MAAEMIPKDVGGIATWGTALAVAVLGAYKGVRMVKSDFKADAHAAARDEFVDALRGRIKEQDARIDELTRRVDDMARQRNDVLVENATLKGELRRLEGEIGHLRDELAEARDELGDLKRRQKRTAATP